MIEGQPEGASHNMSPIVVGKVRPHATPAPKSAHLTKIVSSSRLVCSGPVLAGHASCVSFAATDASSEITCRDQILMMVALEEYVTTATTARRLFASLTASVYK